MYFVYILLCKDNTLYTGITTDLKRRVAEHRQGVGSAYTRSRGVKQIVYFEKKAGRSAALRREAAIKKLSRTQKQSLFHTTRTW